MEQENIVQNQPVPEMPVNPAGQVGQPGQETTNPQVPPDYAEFYASGADKLNVILQDITRRDNMAVEIRTLAGDSKRLEKEINDQKKALDAELNSGISNEREKYIAEESKKITDSNAAIRKTKSDRNKAKEQGIKNRIENETAAMITESKDTHRYIRRTLKENGLPGYCDNAWFYTMYCSQGIVEWLIRILVFLVGLVAIPGIVVAIVNPWFFLKFILWVGVMVVFVAIYLTIFLLTKDKDNGTLEEMREYRDKIRDNKKKIKAVKKGIKADVDESQYNLGDYDIKIVDLEKIVEEATREKERKLKEFEEVKKQQLIDSINAKHIPVINDKQYMVREKTKQYEEKSRELNALSQQIEENYEKYLTKSYTNPDAIRRMLEMINNNGAQNIGQALEMLKR